MSKRQDEFVERLRRSRASVETVAAWLRVKGYQTTAPDHTCSPDWRPTEDHVDSGDVWIVTRFGDTRRLEVKQPNIVFTCLYDWPFRGEMFLTNAKATSRWEDEPLAHIIVNRSMTHAAIVHELTRPYWFKRDVYMKNVGRAESTWMVSPDHALFVRLTR